MQRVARAIYSGLRWPEHKADHSPPLVPRLSMCGNIPPFNHTFSQRGAKLNTRAIFATPYKGERIQQQAGIKGKKGIECVRVCV